MARHSASSAATRLLLRKRGMSFRDIAAKLKVPRTTVRRALAHLKDAA